MLSQKWLFVGQINTGHVNTAQMRHAAIRNAFHSVDTVCDVAYKSFGGRWFGAPFRRLALGYPQRALNQEVVQAAHQRRPDVVWFDKGNWISPQTLRHLKAICAPVIVHYTPDPAFVSHSTRHFRRSVPEYDLLISTKEYEAAHYHQAGARALRLLPPTFDAKCHRPTLLTPVEWQRFGCDVVFIGTYNQQRDRPLEALSKAGVDLAIWGNGWEGYRGNLLQKHIRFQALSGTDYTKAINGAAIGLGLLCKLHPDRSTTRSVEIPACGTMLLAERTEEHCRMYREGEEAEFFSCDDELVAKVTNLLKSPSRRKTIAENGHRKVFRLNCDVDRQMSSLIEDVMALTMRTRKVA